VTLTSVAYGPRHSCLSPHLFVHPDFRGSTSIKGRDAGARAGVIGNEFTEVGYGAGEHGGAEVRKSRLDSGIGQGGIDLPVWFLDDLGGSVARGAEALPGVRFVARYEIANSWNLGKRFRTCRCFVRPTYFVTDKWAKVIRAANIKAE
jgi:hypothetical protein